MNEFELKILDWIQTTLRCGFLDPIMKGVTHLGDAGIFWIVLAALLLIFKRTRPLGIAMGVALVLDLILCNGIVKPLVNRPRPYTLKGLDIYPLVSPPSDPSFPSGHTAASFASAFALLFKKHKAWIPAMILAALIAFSRLYLYIHFPTDVLGGIVIGLIVGFLGAKLGTMLEKAIRNKFPKAL